MIALAVESIRGRRIQRRARTSRSALDVASSHFYREGRYELGEDSLDSGRMIDRSSRLGAAVPHRQRRGRAGGGRLASTGPRCAKPLATARWSWATICCARTRSASERAIEAGACNALLLKVNQMGTLTEAARALGMARAAGWTVVLSVRSGETEDDWAADLAAGWGARPVQERLDHAIRAPVKVQPPAADRGADRLAFAPGPISKPRRVRAA